MAACQFSDWNLCGYATSPQVPLTNSAPAMSQSTLPIGIDLGTTYSCVAVYQEQQAKVIPNLRNYYTIPSMVAFDNQSILVGQEAKDFTPDNPANIVFEVKRLIGRRFDDPTVQSDMKHWPFKVVDESGKPKIEVEYKGETKRFSPEEISSMLLKNIKEFAEAYLKQEVTDAVITVPAYFTNAQRQATKNAGAMAGLNVLSIINKPTAAAISYGRHKKGPKNVLIFDMGGGTFDISILQFDKYRHIKVKAIAGDTHLGGVDFDNRLVNHFVQVFKNEHNIDLSNNMEAMHYLRVACETAKRDLSQFSESRVRVPSIFTGIKFYPTITRTTFEELCADLFNSILETLKFVLRSAKMSKNQINEVVLIGGSTRIPKVHKLLQDYFKGKKLHNSIKLDEEAALGAALQAAILSSNTPLSNLNSLLGDVAPFSLGVEVRGGEMRTLIKRNTPIPACESKIFRTSTHGQTSIGFSIHEGVSDQVKENSLIGFFFISVPPARSGKERVSLTFEVDLSGVLKVTTEVLRTGEKSIISDIAISK